MNLLRLSPLFSVFIVIVFVNHANADLVTFDFDDSGLEQAGIDLDNLHMGTVSVGDAMTGATITLHATAGATAGTDFFNKTTGGFGINASGSGDDTDAFDDGAGSSEFMTFWFTSSIPVQLTFTSIDFDRLDGAFAEDGGEIEFTGGSTLPFDDSATDGNDLLIVNESILAGQEITLSHISGAGFGLEQITLNVQAIPEAGSVLFGTLVCGIMGLTYAGRRMRKAAPAADSQASTEA